MKNLTVIFFPEDLRQTIFISGKQKQLNSINIWIDIDQVNSHPTIMKSFMSYTKHHSPLLNQCFENREEFLNFGGETL